LLDLFSNSNIVIGNNVANSTYGIMLRYLADGNSVIENSVTNSGCGIRLDMGPSSNNVSGNNLTSNGLGIYLDFYSDDNLVSGNNIVSNSAEGILLDSSSNTNITGNIVVNNGYGVGLVDSANSNNVYGNNIVANDGYGIKLDSSSSNSISGNNLTENGVGVELDSSSKNTFCLNNFLNNTVQVSSSGSTSVWDGGYPSGGNYWSDYVGMDVYSGPSQNQKGSDGIGDTPYIIDANNRDRYPLVKPFASGVHDVAVTGVLSSKTVIFQGFNTTISVTVANLGDYTETFNVVAYVDTTSIGSESVTVPAGNSSTIAFAWNTTGFAYGNHTLSAYAWSVPGETNTSNNNCTGGWVTVSLHGDLTGPNGWPDGKVDIRDIAYIAKLFGTTPSSPNWNANADINNDGKVDIRDVHLAAVNYGQHYP
jgi:parallel beta-helix repeat protein